MLKAITSVVQIQNALSRRNPEFDLGKLEIYDFCDLVDILGSASLKQARKIVGRRGILWKTAARPEEALSYAQRHHGGKPAFWARDGSGYYGQIQRIPVLKDKPGETLTGGDVQIIVELMIASIGIEGYRSILLQEEKQKEVMASCIEQSGQACSWDNFSAGKNATGKMFWEILDQMDENNLKRIIRSIREQKEARGEMYVEIEEDC